MDLKSLSPSEQAWRRSDRPVRSSGTVLRDDRDASHRGPGVITTDTRTQRRSGGRRSTRPASTEEGLP